MNAVVMQMFQPDIAAMTQHVEHLFGGFLDGYHEGKIELAWTDNKADEAGRYRLRHAAYFGTDELERLVEKAAALNSVPMTNVYIGAALRHPDVAPFGRSKDEDAWALTALYVDLDDPGATTKAREIYAPAKPSMVVQTGREPHLRGQCWWRLSEPLTDAAKWPAALRGLAVALDGDATVTNPGRVMRLAGSIAWPVKEGRTAVELTCIRSLKEPGQPIYAVEHLTSLFPPIDEAVMVGVDISTVTAPVANGLGLVTDKITDGRERYMLNTTYAVLLEYIGTNGCVPDAQELFDAAWPQYERKTDFTRPGRGKKEFAEKCQYTLQRFERGEIRGMRTLDEAIASYQAKRKASSFIPKAEVRSIEAKEAEKKAESPAGKLLLTPREFIAGFTPPEYLIDGIMQRGYLYSLTAKTGHGKTAVDMYIGQCLARGLKVHNREVEQGAVLFCAGENPDDIRARYLVLADKMGFDPAEIPFHFINGVIDIAESLSRIQIEAAEIPNLKLVIIDTAAAYFKGDDGNSNVQQGAFARVLRQLTFLPGLPSVLVNCHPTKAATKESLSPVGGGAFLNEVDGNLTLWADGENHTTLHWQGKFRGPEFEPITFQMETTVSDKVRDSKGRHMPSIVARPIGELEIEMSYKVAETDENILLGIIAMNSRCSVSDLAKKANWFSSTGVPAKSKVFRVAERLLADKLISRGRGGKFKVTSAGAKECGLEPD